MKRLQSLSYKTLFTILFFSLGGIVFFLKIGGKTTKVSAAWWDDAWHYRKAISISNSSGSNLTDFQVSVSIGTSQLIAEGKMQSDCDDIRVTDVNGNLVPYWIEENNPGCNQVTDTKIWLKANSLPTSGSTIYLYYGNSSASNNENGKNVFLEFDDFKNPSTINNWTLESNPTTTYSISGGTMSAVAPSGDYSSAVIGSNYTDVIVNSRFTASAGQSHGGFLFRSQSNAADNSYQWLIRKGTSDNRIQKRLGGGQTYLLGGTGGLALPSTFATGTWYPIEFRLSGTQVDTYFNNQQAINGSLADTGFASGKIGILSYDSNEFFDYIFVRKYASSLPTPSVQAEEIGGGPIAYWKFDEGSGTTTFDSTSNQNNGTITGSTWQNEDQCVAGKCLYFSGTSNYVTIPNSKSVQITGNQTISMWLKPTVFGSRRNPINKAYGGEFTITLETGGGMSYYWGTAGANNSPYQGFSSSALTLNAWNYITLVRDITNNQLTWYINGKRTDQTTPSYAQAVASTANITIGSGYAGSFIGYIDEVKLYPYARTADQVKQDYNSRGSIKSSSTNLGIKSNTTPSLNSSLVAYWKFDENNGTSVFDSSKNNITGTFIGATKPTWQTGKYKFGIGFSGVNDSISLPFQPKFRNAFSVSIWFKRTTDYNQTTDVMLLSSPNAWFFYDSYNSGAIRGDVYIDGIRRAGINVPIPFDGNWYHVLYSYDSETHKAKMYRNGKLYQTADLTGLTNYLIDSATGNLSNLGGNSKNRGIAVDEAKIYNRALTDEEVLQDYNAGSAIQFGQTNQTIGGTTTSLDYCIPGDTSYCTSPIAEWNFEENTGTVAKDTSGNNNGTFGTGSSAPIWSLGANNKGSGIKFDGNDFISNGVTQGYTGNLNINFWIKTNSSTTGTIVSKYGNNSYWTYRIYKDTNGKINFERGNNTAAWTNTLTSNKSINDNNWHFISTNYDSTKMYIYIDGQLDNSVTETRVADGTNYYNFCIGNDHHYCAPAGPKGFFNGSLDGIKIYNYARTPAQIAYDYNKGGPVGWWKFDECQGNTINDSSGVGNTGVIVIGSSGTQNSIGTCQIGTSAAWTNGASGKINSSLNFDGDDDYINIINNPILNLANNNYSISIWFKSAMSMTDNPGMILQRYTGGAPGAGYWIAIQSNKVYFENRADGGDHLSITSNSSYNDHLWHQVIITVDTITKSGKMYIDGNYIKSDTYSGNILNNNANMTLGGQGSNYSFNGQIDDVRIYNYALTDEQIKQVYNGGAINFQ